MPRCIDGHVLAVLYLSNCFDDGVLRGSCCYSAMTKLVVVETADVFAVFICTVHYAIDSFLLSPYGQLLGW